MCGMCGRYNLDGAPVERAELLAMAATIAHRGPDEEGVLVRPGVGLGHRRLSIIDLPHGQQPMCNEDGSVWIVYNGEVYNYLGLREELLSRGHTFRTRCDTEVLVHGYEEWGADLLPRTNGMFSLAILDRREGGQGTLFLARDRLGIKPLYLARVGESLLFASEIKALLACGDLPAEVRPEGILSYLTFGYSPDRSTLLRRVERLDPGSCLTIGPDGPPRRRVWYRIPAERPRDDAPPQAQIEGLRELLSDAVHLRLHSDVPLGVFLSGGVDSCAVAGTLATSGRVKDQLKTFCVGFDLPGGENEFDYAAIAARKFDTAHHEYVLSPQEFIEFLPRMVWYLDEPLSDESSVSIYFVSRTSSEQVKVVLSGEGSDEILAGYSIYRRMLMLERLRGGIGPLGRLALDGISRGVSSLDLPLSPAIRKYIYLVARPLESRYLGVHLLDPVLKDRLLGPELRNATRGHDPLGPLAHRYSQTRGLDPLSRMLHADQHTWLPNNILLKADKMSMANSIELRVPFLDHRLVERAWSLPSDLKMHGDDGKYALKRAVEGFVPQECIVRQKKGFPTPLGLMLKGQLRGFTQELLLSNRHLQRGYVDEPMLRTVVDEHLAGGFDHQKVLWPLMVLEMWHRSFVDGGGIDAVSIGA